jgi:hypothetical protein
MTQNYSSTSPVLGLTLPNTGCPDYEPGNAVGLFVAAITTIESAVFGLTAYTAAGAITLGNGKAILKAGSAAAMTLAAPVAGLPSAGGNDGQEIVIISDDAYAYTVTTPSNKINGAKHVATWTAAIGNSLRLVAYNGVWLTADPVNGVTLS